MDHTSPRLSSITGVGRALIATLGMDQAISVMVTQFGWDATVQAVAALEGPVGGRALMLAVEIGLSAS